MKFPPLSEGARQFLRFSMIGIVGFVVDAVALVLAMRGLGLGLYSGRVLSFFLAATATWGLNRRFTFATVDHRPLIVQWVRFVFANSIGGGTNYGVYAALVTFVPFVTVHPVLGVAAGAFAGLAFNFSISKFWVFRTQKPANPEIAAPPNGAL